MRKSTTLGLILASAMAVTTLAFAVPQDGGHPGGHHGWQEHGQGHGLFRIFGKLDLTDAQRASIKQIIHDSFSQNKEQRLAIIKQRQAFLALTPDQPGYQPAAASFAQTSADASKARVLQSAKVYTRVYAQLNADQKTKLASLITQIQARRQQWKQFQQQNPPPSAPQASAQ